MSISDWADPLSFSKRAEGILSLVNNATELRSICENLYSHPLIQQPNSSDSDPEKIFARGWHLYALYFYLATLRDPGSQTSYLTFLAAQDDFLFFVRALHKIPSDIHITRLDHHEIGTTSFIFVAQIEGFGPAALKLIQAPYIGIKAVRAATQSYGAHYGFSSPYSPQVYRSEETWILMDYVDGQKLSDFLATLRKSHVFMSQPYFNSISGVIRQITEALDYYSSIQPPIHHGDLNPSNIIVQGSDSDGVRIWLLDFGPNYVLQDRIVSNRTFSAAFERTSIFSPPEVMNGQSPATLRADLYSVGMIGLEMVSREQLRKDEIGLRLREVWEQPETVGIARVLEDLIDEYPQNRAIMLSRFANISPYAALNKAAQESLEIYRDIVKPQAAETTILGALQRGRKLPDVWRSVRNLYTIVRLEHGPYASLNKSTVAFGGLNAILQAIIVTSFAAYTFLDIKSAYPAFAKIPFLDDYVSWAIEQAPKQFVVGDIWGNLPGRSVALTFGLIAARYYANIFSTLISRGIGDWRDLWTNFFLRINSFSYFAPIMYAIVWNPHAWPFCAFIGTLFPAFNNRFCWKASLIGADREKKQFRTAKHYDTIAFLSDCKEWWVLQGTYSLGIGVIGLLLSLGLAKDEAIYAASVCVINIFKVYRNNCGREAPYFYGNLSRLFFASDRWSFAAGRMRRSKKHRN